MKLNSGRALCGILITGGVLLAGTATAATPESGKIDSANPKVTWTGEVTASWFPSRAVILADAAGESGSVPCEAPTCDTFALEVGEKKDMTIGVSAPENTSGDQLIVRIQQPDGSYTAYVEDSGGDGYVKMKFKGAAPGAWVVDYWNYYTDGPVAYNGFAELAVPAAAAPAPAPAPGPSGPAPAPQQSGTIEAIALDVKVGKASARKLAKKKKLVATVKVSRQARVAGTLKKGKKTVGKGALSAVNGTGKLNIKLSKKLKKGTYALTVSATDGRTSTVKTVKVKVAK